MVRKIIGVKDPRLRKRSKVVKKIDKKVLSLIQNLRDTLSAQKDPEGIGLAAPQIGKNQRVFIARLGDETKTFINPKITSKSDKKRGKQAAKKGSKPKRIMEGCLSLPHFYGPLKRAGKIKVKYLNEKGKEVVGTFESFEAQVVQHEIDHLNGVIFVDRLLEQNKPLFEFAGDEWKRVELQ